MHTNIILCNIVDGLNRLDYLIHVKHTGVFTKTNIPERARTNYRIQTLHLVSKVGIVYH